MTSEQMIGIPMPPDHQCNTIDNYIKIVEEGIRDLEGAIKCDTLDDASVWMRDALHNLEDVPTQLEDLRTACDELRCWGQGWKDRAKELEEELEEKV